MKAIKLGAAIGALLLAAGCAGSPENPGTGSGATTSVAGASVATVKVPRVVGFYADWRRNQVPPKALPWDRLTHVAHAFALPKKDGSIDMTTALAIDNMAAWARHHKVKPMLSIGGANGSGPLKDIGLDPALRKKFIANVMALVKKHKLAGIDIDFEHWPTSGVRDVQGGEALLALLKDLYAVLKPAGIELSTDVFGSDWLGKNYPAEIVNHVDWVNLMIYDNAGSWSQKPEADSSVKHVKDGLAYWEGRMGRDNRHKLQLCVPFYGKKFRRAHRTGSKVEGIDYEKIAQIFPNAAAQDDFVKDGYHYFYNGRFTMKEKLDIVAKGGYAGVSIWELTGDSPRPRARLMEVFSKRR